MNITYNIYSILEDNNLFLIKLNQEYKLKDGININIMQSIIFYKQ